MPHTILTVDRIEQDTVVLERDKQMFDVPLALLPNVKEGDQLQIIILDNTKTQDQSEARLERLKQRSPPSNDIIDL